MSTASTLRISKTKLATKEQTSTWHQDFIDPTLVIRFPQVRKTFDSVLLQELADDIAQKSMIQPPVITRLDPEHFKIYADVFDKMSKTVMMRKTYPSQVSIDDPKSHHYYVLIAGERRYRANMILWETGCTACKELATKESRVLKPGECFTKHSDKDHMGLMECRVRDNVNAKEAKSIQFRENNYIKPPVNEEAYAYKEHFDYLKISDPKLTFKEFAVEVGVSVEKVRKAIWFCELPEMVRTAVEKKFVSYSNALELRRIMEIDVKTTGITREQKNKMLESECLWLIINPKIKHDDYKVRVTNIINQLNTPTLFDTTPFQMKKKDRRAIVGKNFIAHMSLMNGYAIKVEQVIEQGIVGIGKSYSGISPTKQLKDMASRFSTFIPGFDFTEDQLKLISKFSLEK